MNKPIIATITDIGFDRAYKKVRAECTLKTFEAAQEHGYQILTVDAGSPPEYIQKLKDLGAHVYIQEEPGMGNAQRQALALARDLASEDNPIIWTESEKYPLIPLLREPTEKMTTEGYDLVMLSRISLDSYPPEQIMSYKLIALAAFYLTEIECDFGWGPTVISPRATHYYTNYESSYGDSWDAIHCPKLHIIKDELPWTIVPVDYVHPPEQTAAETGMTLFMKRIRQAEQLVDAMTREVGRIGLSAAGSAP